MLRFTVIPASPPAHGPEDLFIRFIANRSIVGPIEVRPDDEILLPELVNVSVLGALRVTSGDDFDILLPALVNASVLNSGGNLEVQESPPDGHIYLPDLVNVSLVNDTIDMEVAESPPDGYIYPPALVNANTLGELVVEDAAEDHDSIAGAIVGGGEIA